MEEHIQSANRKKWPIKAVNQEFSVCKTIFQNEGRIKIFPDKQKQTTLYDYLKAILQADMLGFHLNPIQHIF